VKKAFAVAVVFLSASILSADISVTDRSATLRALTQSDNQAKRETKKAHRHGQQLGSVSSGRLHPHATGTGDISLIDAAGLQYFINTNITSIGGFSSGSSLSAGASEASYTAAVAASTLGGGSVPMVLVDMFDGYNSLCVSLTAAPGPCTVGSPAYAFYYQTGAAPVFDATVPAVPACTNRQLVFPAKTIGALSIRRKVFVPNNDQFIRWLSFFTNTSGVPVTFTMISDNNLGSDGNTVITGSSSGDNAAQVTDTWVATFQSFGFPTATTSSDPRIGHVLQGTGAPTPVSNIFFANTNDQPFWTYAITLAPGQTKAILNFATGQGTKAAAAAKAAALALLPANATQCLSTTELGQVTNFAISTDLSITKSTTAPNAFGGNPITYTLAVSNAGPSPANTVSVSDTLPAGSTFVSASGTGWTCNNVAGVVTCTVATLPVGAAPVISLKIIAPPVVAAGTLSNTATVSSATTDTNPTNNTSTSAVPIFPGSQIPALSTWMLMMLAAMLAVVALARRT